MNNLKCNADCQVNAKMFRFFHASKLCWKVNFFVSFSLSLGKDYTPSGMPTDDAWTYRQIDLRCNMRLSSISSVSVDQAQRVDSG